MNLSLRQGQPSDANACGIICYEAFKNIAGQHNFPEDFPNAEAAIGLMNYLLSASNIYSVIAGADGQIAGSNFLWQQDFIGGVGPITVNPSLQNASTGKRLMEQVLQHAAEQKLAGVRLVQAAYHNRSFALYSKLGFDVQEPLATIQGSPLGISFSGYHVRAANEGDLDACNDLCCQVHGIRRHHELVAALTTGTAAVVEYDGKITGYTTQVGFFGHTVAATNMELKALIGAAAAFAGPGFLLPSRNAEVLRWCLNNGLKVIQPMNLMSKGLYNQPAGAFLPSVLY
ncbi:MAG: GNAT family N-acetyltransferase [Ferruginibacter sp.]